MVAEEKAAMRMATKLKRWTLDEVHSLPDDGNKYELIHGELFVTPSPSDEHETILARLSAVLVPYVQANGLGLVYYPRAVFRFEGSEVEPDLMVRSPARGIGNAWERAALPILIVEVASPATYRRDRTYKKDFYGDAGIPEYWMVDPERRLVTVSRPGETNETIVDTLTWKPRQAEKPLAIDLSDIFSADGN